MPRRLFWISLLLCLIALTPAQITRSKVAPRELPFTPINKWAMVVGASDYKELGKLNFAAKDAEAFANVLKERFGFSREAIELLTDNPDSTEKPTVDRIAAALDRQLADARLSQGDLFIFYFSGHGIGTPKGDFLMPTDATAAEAEKAGQNVKEIVEKFVKAGLRNVLVIVDACRGGEKNEFGDDLRRLGKEANIAVMLSCEPGARSYEYPRLGHGAFTSFLIKSLKSMELTSTTTGTLWASVVAKDVSQKVRDYTARDYPNQPQTPTGWAEPTMDVLLGAFPTEGAGRLKIADLAAETERLSRDEYVDAYVRYGEQMYVQERYSEAAECWRVVDSLKPLEPGIRFLLAWALESQGKEFEMQNELAKLRKLPGEHPFLYLVNLWDPSRSITPAQRIQAAKEFWKLERKEWAGQLVWAVLQEYASDADTLNFLKDFLTLDGISPKMRLFFEGYEAGYAGDWGLALKKWEAAKLIDSPLPNDESLDASIFQALVYGGEFAKIEGLVLKSSKTSGQGKAIWNLILAQYYKEYGRYDEMVAQLQIALTKKLRPGDLLWSLRIAGLRFPAIADKVVERANEMPYVWKAMVAKVWASKLGGGEQAIQEAILECTKYTDDEFAVIFECLRLLEETLEERHESGALAADKYSQLMVAYSAIMASEVDKFGYDHEAWTLLSKFSFLSEKVEQVLALFNHYLGPLVDNGTLDPMLRAPFLYCALQMNDSKRAEQIWKLGGFPPSERVDGAWIMAMFRASNGDIDGAKAIMPTQEPSKAFLAPSRAFKLFLKVKAGEKVNLDSEKAALENNSVALQWLALAYVEQKNWVKAMPLLEEHSLQRQIGFTFVQAKAVQAYFDRLIANQEFEQANQVAYNIAISGYGNPLFKRVHFGATPTISAFKGEIDMEAAEFDLLPDMDRGSVKITIDAAGNVSGKAVIADKVKTITGNVDQFGNLIATISDDAKKWTMTGKIAPPAMYKSLENFKSNGQIFLLLDEKGQSRFLIGRPR